MEASIRWRRLFDGDATTAAKWVMTAMANVTTSQIIECYALLLIAKATRRLLSVNQDFHSSVSSQSCELFALAT